jgi:5-methyltetrahydrofolate--homocysteine methyltransferase
MRKSISDIQTQINERVLILDGATGTYLQQHGSSGCNDALCLTNPQLIRQMHSDYIAAGADIIETNSFNCNRFSLTEYGLEDKVYDISKKAAEIAREAAGDTVLVAGSIGPTSKTLSMSTDVNTPESREVSFQEMHDTYCDQVRGLIDGGADLLLVETVFDTLNCKCALKAIEDVCKEMGIVMPVMVSVTLSDNSGRTLSGQTLEAFVASIGGTALPSRPETQSSILFSVGLNCGFGAKQLLPYIKRLNEIVPYNISVHPNAGLPNVMGEYDETPETFAANARQALEDGLRINIFGGCCGTTPDHIRALKEVVRQYTPNCQLSTVNCQLSTVLSGLESLRLNNTFINVGERTNVAGSAKFKKLIAAKDYEAALSVARQQVENGAQVIDICMDDGMIEGVEAMTTFLRLIAAEPEIAKVPIMIDSSKWDIIKAGLENVQGKSIVNSISLKEGEEPFLKKAKHIQSMGAATVVMLFDEQGQADSYERKVSVARRAYALLKGIGFPTQDIIFDPNVLAVATGMPEHNDYARAFIEACRTIHQEMPEVHLSGGISNLSFSFRGNNVIRQAMHSVFLYYAMQAGLDMSIVNPAMTTIYSEIPEDLRNIVEDVILNRDETAGDRLMAYAESHKPEASSPAAKESASAAKEGGDLHSRISHAFLKGITDEIEELTTQALKEVSAPLAVIDTYLMPAMEEVGRLFGEGKMFLPQVVKSARVMKKAVAVLEPYMAQESAEANNEDTKSSYSAAPIVFATVRGDVHDIGKNISAVVLQCNGYKVHDLGVMVETNTIVDTAAQEHSPVICLSGLITPSLDEMIKVLQELRRRGMKIPVIVGGATTSDVHTAVKMAPEYEDCVVIHSPSAAENANIIRHLLGENSADYIADVKAQQEQQRQEYAAAQQEKAPQSFSLAEARQRRHIKKVTEVAIPSQEAMRPFYEEVSLAKVRQYINWNMFFQAWGLKGNSRTESDGQQLRADAEQMLREIEVQNTVRLIAKAQIMPAYSTPYDEIVINGHILPMPRSKNAEGESKCLADYILRKEDGNDFICPFVVSAGIGLKELQEHYRSNNDEYRATIAKLLCDRLTEALAEYLEKRIGWGTSHIRMAFGYGACPDHALKRDVFDLLGVDFLSLTETNMIIPGETICGLLFANTPTKYFNV